MGGAMTRRDYVLLSDALLAARRNVACSEDGAEQQVWGVETAARIIAHALAQRNRMFDQPRFLRDAGVE